MDSDKGQPFLYLLNVLGDHLYYYVSLNFEWYFSLISYRGVTNNSSLVAETKVNSKE